MHARPPPPPRLHPIHRWRLGPCRASWVPLGGSACCCPCQPTNQPSPRQFSALPVLPGSMCLHLAAVVLWRHVNGGGASQCAVTPWSSPACPLCRALEGSWRQPCCHSLPRCPACCRSLPGCPTCCLTISSPFPPAALHSLYLSNLLPNAPLLGSRGPTPAPEKRASKQLFASSLAPCTHLPGPMCIPYATGGNALLSAMTDGI